MENDDNDLKDYSLPLLMKQSTDDRDDNAKPDLFAKANLESSKGKLIHRDTKLNAHAPSDDEDYLMSDVTSELTSQTYGRQTASRRDVMPLTDLSGSSGPGVSPLVRELLGNTTGRYYVFVGDLSPEVDDDILAMAFSAFGTMSDARVMWDNNSGKSHGYGFLAFVDKTDAEWAIVIMNGKRLGSREIRVDWANQETQGTPPDTTASFYRPVTSGSAPAPSGSEYGRLLHDSLPLLGEPRNNRLLVDEGFLEGVEAPDYRPDFATSGSTDPSEWSPGTLLSDPEDSTLSPDTLPHCKTVASAKMINVSHWKRKRPARFKCSLCTQTFTTNTNLKSKPSSADIVVHELINIFQTMSMFTWALRDIVVVVRGHLLLRQLSGDIVKLVKCGRNLCNNQVDMKMIRSLKSKVPCPSVATTRPSGMFPESCKTIPSILSLSSALLSLSTPPAEASSTLPTSITHYSIQFLSTSCCCLRSSLPSPQILIHMPHLLFNVFKN